MYRSQVLAVIGFLALPSAPAIAFDQPAIELAQMRPPAELRGAAPRDWVEPAQGVDAAGLMLRIDRLENQVRGLTGQLEQMQFANRRLEEQVKKFQQDVEFRFQEGGGKGAAPRAPSAPASPGTGRRTDRQDGVAPSATPSESTPLSGGSPTRLGRRSGDAFDPEANPDAPGAPRQLGSPNRSLPRAPATSMTSGPLGDVDQDLDAPIDLMNRNPRSAAAVSGEVGGPNANFGAAPPNNGLPGGSQVGSIAPSTPREEYDRAAASLRGGQFEAAETGFRSFMQKYPKSSLLADATYNLGESYLRRQRPREAAEQYLKVTTDYSKSNRAPEALVKLGMSLEKLGAKEQACAAYGEVGRKYPNTNATVRASAERESKRAQC